MRNISLEKIQTFFDYKGEVLRMPGYNDHIPLKVLDKWIKNMKCVDN